MRMRVMLIQPPMYHLKMQLSPNLGLAYIAAVLERDGFEVQVVDAAAENLDFDGVIERIRVFSPSVIGAGGQTPVSQRAMTIFARAKEEISRDIVTVAGGPHFSFADREGPLSVVDGKHLGLYGIVWNRFSNFGWCLGYWVWLACIGLHLSHGVQSLVQTLGIYNDRYERRLLLASHVIGALVTLGFASIPFYVYFIGTPS